MRFSFLPPVVIGCIGTCDAGGPIPVLAVGAYRNLESGLADRRHAGNHPRVWSSSESPPRILGAFGIVEFLHRVGEGTAVTLVAFQGFAPSAKMLGHE